MNILFLTQIIPYPPNAGPRIKTWHVLRYLSELGHRITLAAFMREEEREFLPYLEEVCASVHTVPMSRSRFKDVGYWLRSNLSGRPFLIERDDLKEMRVLIDEILEGENIDVIHADQLTMAQFALDGRGNGSRPVRVFDAHNAVWKIVERMQENAPLILRPVAALEARRVKQYEGLIVNTFEHTLTVTEIDRQALLEATREDGVADSQRNPTNVAVIPIAVDTTELQPVARKPGSLNLVTLGTLHYPPNADGIRWFAREVFPLVKQRLPQASLTIIGKNPPVDFQQMAAREPESIQVTGYVEDLAPYLEQAGVMVIAVRAGGGMRVRILEAFARGMPVVTTTVGLEGIEARVGEEVLVADTADEFARTVVRALQDPDLQARLSANGRRLAEQRYDWQKVLGEMDFYQGERLAS